MDLGVGNIIFSSALISKEKFSNKNILVSIKKMIPIIGLGLIRLISVKISGYHVSIKYYQINWFY